MNPPDVRRRVAPKKGNITDDAAEAMTTAAARMPRLWVIIILGIASWVLMVFVGWMIYANWIAPALVAG